MQPFRFRLETLLKLRRAERDRRQVQYAEALHASQVVQRQADELAQEVRQLELRARELSAPGRIAVDQLIEVNRYEMLLQARHLKLRQQLQQVEAEVARRRELLLEADRQLRALEKLRDRQQELHRKLVADSELKELDEVGQRCRPEQESLP